MLSRRRFPDGAAGLAGAPIGVPVRLAAVDLPPSHRLRLAQLGLRPGAVVTVLHRMAGGARLVALGSSRVAVDPATARAVTVDALAVDPVA